jgi:hypothetical protein
MRARVITLLCVLWAALGVLSGDSRANVTARIESQLALTVEAAPVVPLAPVHVHARSALHSGDVSTNDFVQRSRIAAHARTLPTFAKRWILAEEDHDFLGRALDFAHRPTAEAVLRPPLGPKQARAPPV